MIDDCGSQRCRRGHRYGVIGSNGSGKTTLMARCARWKTSRHHRRRMEWSDAMSDMSDKKYKHVRLLEGIFAKSLKKQGQMLFVFSIQYQFDECQGTKTLTVTNNNLDMFIAINSHEIQEQKNCHGIIHFRRFQDCQQRYLWLSWRSSSGFASPWGLLHASLPGFGMLKNRKCV